MQIKVTGVGMKIGEPLQDYVEKRLDKFQRFFGDEATCYVKFTPEAQDVKAEITLKIRRDLYRAESVAVQAETALDDAVNALERQIHKHKTKIKKRKHSYDCMEAFINEIPVPEEQDELPEIARRKRFMIEAMHDEEAALQMELLDHDFFLYLNPETGRVCCIYKRRDGDYGILEPEY